MRWLSCRIGLIFAAMVAAAACDRLDSAKVAPAPSSAAAAPASELDLRALAGKSYAEAAASPEMMRYSATSLRLTDSEHLRFEAGMAVEEPGVLAAGGGAEALVFAGCAVSGCAHGRSVLAIDLRTGAAFVGVSGQGGSEQLVSNDRIEALLRVTSPTMQWDDPIRAPQVASPSDDDTR